MSNLFGTKEKEKKKESKKPMVDVFGYQVSPARKADYEAEKELFGDSILEKTDKEKSNKKQSSGKKSSGYQKSYSPKESSSDKPNLEPIYSDYVLEDENYSVCSFGEYINLYHWKNGYWNQINKISGEGMAMNWIRKNDRNEATDYRSKTCHSTALKTLYAENRLLPKRPTSIIIPMIDTWLEVHEDGIIFMVEPDKTLGVTYQIKGKVCTPKNTTIIDDFGNELQAVQQSVIDNFGNKDVYIPKAVPTGSLVHQFLENSVPLKSDQRLLAQYTGCTLIPDTRFQAALVIEGPGLNGKSEYANAVSGMHQKVASIDLDDLKGFGKAELVDASLVVVPETPKRSINEQELKKIISGDKIVINQKNKDMFTYEPTAKCIICCNCFPLIQDESNGIWRRFIMMKFDNVITKDKIVTNLAKRIIAEEMNIFVDWALAGLVDLLQNKDFSIPAHVTANKETEKKNSKNPLVFIEDMYVELSEECKMRKDDFFNKYKMYCEEKGWNSFGEVQFWKIVKQKFPSLQTLQKREIEGRKLYCNLFFDLSQADEGNEDEIEEFQNSAKKELEKEIKILDLSLSRKTISVISYGDSLKKAYEKYAQATH